METPKSYFPSSPIRYPLGKVLLYNTGFWVLLWLVSVWNNYQWASASGTSFTWNMVFSWSFPYYLMMTLLGPMIYALYRFWDRKGSFKRFTYHIGPSVLSGFIHQFALNVFFVWFNTNMLNDQSRNFAEKLSSRYESGFYFSANGFLFYWLCIGIIFSVDLYFSNRKQRDSNLALQSALDQARLVSLQRQIQPHFLFNTFNGISMLARKGQQKEVVQMIAHLSDLLRETLNIGNEQLISLEREIGLIRKYLQIEEVRFRDRLEVHYQIDEQLYECKVPCLFLQPIVENAFQHGFNKIEGPVQLILKAEKKENLLLLTVSNSAPRMEKNRSLNDNMGLGLSNIMDRLSHLYDEASDLSVDFLAEASMVKVTVSLPCE